MTTDPAGPASSLPPPSPSPTTPSTTCATGCGGPAGPSGRPSTTGPRASRWTTCRRCARRWRDDYDWRVVESELNRYQQLRFTGHGPTGEEVGIQVLHAPSPEPDAIPVAFTHGWPGSVVEFLDVIEPLRDPRTHGGDPADAMHVVCPTLPGYGFSGKPTRHGLDRRAHRRRVGSADDGSRLRPLRGARRRLGRDGHRLPRVAAPRAAARHPPEHGLRGSWQGPRRAHGGGTSGDGLACAVPGMGLRATPSNRRRDRKPSAMAWSTHRRLRRRGSSRSSGRGATMTATPKG